jgi:hypothetical protein
MLPWMGVTSGIGAGLLGSFMAGISYTGLMFSVFMNTFNQSMSYLKDPDNFQFNSLSFMWDTGTSPLGQVTASAIFGRWNIFNKIPVLNEAGEKIGSRFAGSNPLAWINWRNFAKAEAAFAATGFSLSLARSVITGTDPQKNVDSFRKGFSAAAAQGVLMEILLESFPSLFPGGRKGDRYLLLSRGLSILRGVLFAPPNTTGKAEKRDK